MQVLIYQDYVQNNGVLYRSLCRHFGTDNVGWCDAREIAAGCLTRQVALFVMPGGADLYYAEKLNGAGNAAIRHYVENGGVYLGICAGAYYACAALDWAAQTDQAINGPRQLAFFPGTAFGPVQAFIEDGDINKSWRAAAEISYDDGVLQTESLVLYHAGPVFVPDPGASGFKVLARYEGLEGKPAAIVSCQVGAGKAVLCAPHLEFTGDDLHRALHRHRNPSWDWDNRAAQTLGPDETFIRRLWQRLLQHCGERA